MRHLILTALSLTALALMAGCAKKADTTEGASATTEATATAPSGDTRLDSMNIRASLIDGTRAYKFALDGDSCYLTISARIDWPREIGDAKLGKLADTLTAAAFPLAKGKSVETAITDYLNNTNGIISGASRPVSPNEIPDTTSSVWSISTAVARTVITPRLVTYTATTMSYLGGAHPTTVVTPVSYDLAAGEVITPSYLFTPGSDSKIIGAVTSNLAARLGCTPSTLRQGGLLVDKLPMPTGMYIDEYGSIVFQYGQYEIAPYSMGIITVEVSPYQLRDVLTPAGQALLQH